MKLIETRDGWILDEIKEDRDWKNSDIRVKNLAAVQDDPKFAAESVILVYVDDEEIRDTIRNVIGCAVKECHYEERDENGDVTGTITRYSFRLKAYPRVLTDKKTGKVLLNAKGEPRISPKVMLKKRNMEGKFVNQQLKLDKFDEFDDRALSTIAIKFHTFPNTYDPSKPDIAAIDEVWAIANQNAGVIDKSYLEEKYGDYDDEPSIEEVMPFAE